MNAEKPIGCLAREAGISIDTLRYYERIGLLFDVERRSNGHRRYSDWHVRWVRFLKCLRSAGMPIERMRHYADLVRQGDDTRGRRLEALRAHRLEVLATMRQLTEHLETIERKIGLYEEGGCTDDQR